MGLPLRVRGCVREREKERKRVREDEGEIQEDKENKKVHDFDIVMKVSRVCALFLCG